ncbi:MAG: glycerol-3-phosphate dehydrogenase/oxidase [Gemmatimonadaceae bacterium]
MASNRTCGSGRPNDDVPINRTFGRERLNDDVSMRRDLATLGSAHFDVLVVGGGIVGACVARDAALRGFTTALIERNDFCSATSAASSKMIHGGVRYLAQLQFGVVRESLRERRIWLKIAPHLVRPLSFAIPFHGLTERISRGIALQLFDLLAYDRGMLEDPDLRLPRHGWWSAAEARERIPLLDAKGLSGAICYADCQAFAPERLCLECILDAARHGACVANYVGAEQLAHDGARVTGVRARDVATDTPIDIKARCVVNATGPWAGELLRGESGDSSARHMTRSKGVHVIVRSLSDHHAVTLLGKRDHAFVIPWRGHSLLGTTDTPFRGDPDDVRPDESDIALLLGVVNRGMPDAHLTMNDVRYAYAGVRPLLGDPTGNSYTMSRRAEIVDHVVRGGPAGLVSALGGKWTTARHVAEQCTDTVARQLKAGDRSCTTHERPLPGGDVGTMRAFRADALREASGRVPSETVEHLIGLYGALYRDVLERGTEQPEVLLPVGEGAPDIRAQVVRAVIDEQAHHAADVLLRRTGIGTLGKPTDAVITGVLEMMARELGWSAQEIARQRAQVNALYPNDWR